MNATGWTTLSKKEKHDVENQGVKRSFQDESSTCELSLDRQPKRQKPNVDSSGSSTKRPADTEQDTRAPVLRRCRGKQPDPHADAVSKLVRAANQPAKRRGRPNGPVKSKGSNGSKGSHHKKESKTSKGEPHGDEKPKGDGQIDRDGKLASLSIWRKMQIIHEYERLKSLGRSKTLNHSCSKTER